VALTTHTI